MRTATGARGAVATPARSLRRARSAFAAGRGGSGPEELRYAVELVLERLALGGGERGRHEAPTEARLVGDALDGRGRGHCVPGRDEETGGAAAEGLRDTADGRGHDRHAGRFGLAQDLRQAFRERHVQKD